MSNITPIAPREFTEREVSLIRDTVARGATVEEFKLFLYRCQHMGLDPLKPGQIHFVKYGTSPGSIIVGREGFRSRAARTGKHTGTKLGVLRDEQGRCIGAWCEVYRADWTHPAREEVSLSEYNTGKAQWAKMPETMIKKVAEAAALRMAFPDELGGLYVREEMDQAEEEPKARDVSSTAPDIGAGTIQAGDHRIEFGTTEKGYRGMTIREAVEKDGLPRVQQYVNRLIESCEREGKPVSKHYSTMRDRLNEFAHEMEPDWDADFDTAYDAAKAAK